MKSKNLNFFACLENTVAIKAPKQTKQVLKIAKSRMLKVRARASKYFTRKFTFSQHFLQVIDCIIDLPLSLVPHWMRFFDACRYVIFSQSRTSLQRNTVAALRVKSHRAAYQDVPPKPARRHSVFRAGRIAKFPHRHAHQNQLRDGSA